MYPTNFWPSLINTLWFASAQAEAGQFWKAAQHIEATQSALLANYLRANAQTVYGQRYHFSKLRSVRDYQQQVPLTTYDDYTNAIERIGRGEPNVLTAEPVRLLEPSSGSSAASKLIPYTATLKREFQRGLATWITDLFRHRPALMRGPAYWSVSPLLDGATKTSGGIPIGFEDDSAYLGSLGSVFEKVLAVPNAIKTISDVSLFRYVTWVHLLSQPELRLISVWNPTFLSLLLAPLAQWRESLLADIAQGTITPLNNAQVSVAAQLHLPANPTRANQLRTINLNDLHAIWPRLQLISCWMDGPSASYATALQQNFPNVWMQAKGLLATECFVSFPLVHHTGAALAIRSHFFEFQESATADIAPNYSPKLAHELKPGRTYSVIVTTGGGLYRYQLQDLVEVVEMHHALPMLRFVGKANRVADFFGEKLSEAFVSETLSKLFSALQVSPRFAMLVPHQTAQGFYYVLLLEINDMREEIAIERISQQLDALLRANFNYDYCRKLGQLNAASVLLVTDGLPHYLAACQQRGMRLGNIKPVALQTNLGWVSASTAYTWG